MANNLFKFLIAAIVFLGAQKIATAQSTNTKNKVDSLSCQFDPDYGLAFKGKVTLEDGIRLPQTMIFAPRYDTITKLFSGNFELEMLQDGHYVSILHKGFYNLPPLEEYRKLDMYSRQRYFDGSTELLRVSKKGHYRIRIRFYLSHFCEKCVDLYSDWCYVTVD